MQKLYALLFSALLTGTAFSQTCDSLFSQCIGTFSRNGYYFDLEAVNQVNITHFTFMAQNPGSRDITIYYRQGTYVGSEGNASSWTLLGTDSAVTPSTGTGSCPLPTNFTSVSCNVCIPQGQRYGFYIVMSAGTGTIESHSNLSEGSIGAQDANLILYTGKGQQGIGVFTGTLMAGLTFQGAVQYECGCSTGMPETGAASIQLFPNPASSFITLNSEKDDSAPRKVMVYDATGTLVLVSGETTINVKDLARGIYLVRVERAGGSSSAARFIKE